MGIEYEGDKLDELLRLTKENNRMLHKMRRSAWIGGIFRVAMWIAFIIVPLWLYLEYVAPIMAQMLASYEQIQGTTEAARVQLSGMQELLQKAQSLFGTKPTP